MQHIGDDEPERLGSMLRSAFNVAGVATRLPDVPADMEPCLKEVDEAAGEFQALANLVRVG